MPLATVINGGEFFYKPETWPIKNQFQEIGTDQRSF